MKLLAFGDFVLDTRNHPWLVLLIFAVLNTYLLDVLDVVVQDVECCAGQ